MSIRIEIDKQGSVFTCLDLITGRVVFNVEKNTTETVTSIYVKLEGVSRTRLLIPKEYESPHELRNKKAHIEIHKLLYQVEAVFPPEQVRKSQEATGETDFTLPAGTHIYPFSFRIPINNSCRPLDSVFSKISIKGGNVGYAKEAEYHTKNTLPPSLHGLPEGSQGEGGSIRYYIKATVNRPQFYRTNVRKEAFFAFLPIDPPRAVPQGEIYSRREHLLPFPLLTPLPKKKEFWWKSKKPETQTIQHPNEEPRFTIEARLPSPSVLVPREPLGLRIIMVKLAPFKTPVVLRQIQLRLFMTTYITAHGHSKKFTMAMPLFNTSTDYRLGMPIPYTFGPMDASPGVRLEADPRIWENWMLPENISPSFRTCNIARSYQLEVTLGVSLGGNAAVDIPLFIPIEVYTGFSPSPAALKHCPANLPGTLQARSSNPYHTNGYEPPPPIPAHTNPFASTNSTTSPTPSPAIPTFPLPQPQSQPYSPSSPTHERGSSFTGSRSGGIWQPVQPQQAVHMAMADAPPTYEDAVLGEISSVNIMVADGPRREYPLQPGYFGGDGKRLFAS